MKIFDERYGKESKCEVANGIDRWSLLSPAEISIQEVSYLRSHNPASRKSEDPGSGRAQWDSTTLIQADIDRDYSPQRARQ